MSGTSWIYSLLERNLIPDPLISFGIRGLLAQRLRQEDPGDARGRKKRLKAFAEELAAGPVAVHTDAANEQHYEVPADFFLKVLGQRLKYSSAYFEGSVRELDQAELAMLERTVSRADLANGQDILELGCGWGSLTLFMAERFPNSNILAVSNSASQRRYITAEAEKRGLSNVEVLTADMREFSTDLRFDRVVSVEMFEHMRNYRTLLHRISTWLRPNGRLFVHIFCHRHLAYPFEDRGDGDWMARYFFTGGIMPAADLFDHFTDSMRVEERWLVNGIHYQKTSLAWLRNMDRRKAEVMPILKQVYGDDQALRWWVYWRVFFLACAELFGYRGGNEWLVAHYRFAPADK